MILTQARELAEQLLAIRDSEDRDITLAVCIRILGETSDSDGYSRAVDVANEIEAQAKKNMLRSYEAEDEDEWLQRLGQPA